MNFELEQLGTSELAVRPVTQSLFLGASTAIRRVIALARRVAPTSVPVMISGEPGTGRRSLAHFIHAESGHADRPFTSVNCADVQDLLETATDGTVYLDEVVALPHALQSQLLKALENAEARRGDGQSDHGLENVRLVCATSRHLREVLDAGMLRKDLYYRLAVVPITLPPLRDRPEDVPILVRCFMAQQWERHRQSDGPVPQFTEAAIDHLRDRTWRGNVAELRNVIEYLVVLTEPGRCIEPEDIPVADEPIEALVYGSLPTKIVENDYHQAKDTVVALFEKVYLSRLLDRALGNVAEAARLAAIDRATLYRLMDKHGVRRVGQPAFRTTPKSVGVVASTNDDTPSGN